MTVDQRMVLVYILEKGIERIREITDEDVEEMRAELIEQEKELEKKNRIMIMAPDFQVWLVNEARAVCSKTTDEIFSLIKKHAKSL